MRVHLLPAPGPTPPPGELVEAVVVDDEGGLALHPLVVEGGVEPAAHPDEADALLVPGRWQWHSPAQRREVTAAARRHRAPLVVWSNDDPALADPAPGAVVIEPGPSRRTPRRVTLPIFFGELQLTTFGAEPEYRDGPRPRVGFCGQTRQSAVRRTAALVRNGRRRSTTRLRRAGDLRYLPDPWASHLRLRRAALDALARHPGVDLDLVARDSYRGGAAWGADPAARERSRAEFVANVADNDYTLCVRGVGNFSTRLFEALCLGRIPVVVDTGAALAFPDDPFWHEVALVVPAAEVQGLGDRLAAHHARLTAGDGLAAAQQRARRTWQDRLSRKGFLRHLGEALRPALGLSEPPG